MAPNPAAGIPATGAAVLVARESRRLFLTEPERTHPHSVTESGSAGSGCGTRFSGAGVVPLCLDAPQPCKLPGQPP